MAAMAATAAGGAPCPPPAAPEALPTFSPFPPPALARVKARSRSAPEALALLVPLPPLLAPAAPPGTAGIPPPLAFEEHAFLDLWASPSSCFPLAAGAETSLFFPLGGGGERGTPLPFPALWPALPLPAPEFFFSLGFFLAGARGGVGSRGFSFPSLAYTSFALSSAACANGGVGVGEAGAREREMRTGGGSGDG